MRAISAALLLSLALAGPAAAQSADAPPSTPANLAASVYSGTAGAIRWDRSTDDRGLVSGYEVSRDGALLGVFDALSYVDFSLAPGTAYVYRVTAIDNAGQRSGTAGVHLTTPGNADGGAPAAPAGLRGEVYSATAVEIFWDRPATPGLAYEVRRDGAVLIVRDGTSHFDDRLAGGRSYTYEVIAIDPAGRRSAASEVTLTTSGGSTPPPSDNPFAMPDPSGATTVARLGYPAARDLVAELVSAAYLDRYFEVDVALSDFLSADESVERDVDCPGGGGVRITGTVFVYGLLEFDGCVIEDRTLSGRLERTLSRLPIAIGTVSELELDFDALRIDAGEAGTLTVTGYASRGAGRGQTHRCDRFVGTNETIRIVSARLERDGEVTSITDATYSQRESTQDFGDPRDDETPCTTLRSLAFEGTASVVSTRFGAEAATISTLGELDGGVEGASGSATLGADFGDGSTLAVTAISLPGSEVQVDVVSDGAAISFTDEYTLGTRVYAPTVF